jgi:hypothetical protein
MQFFLCCMLVLAEEDRSEILRLLLSHRRFWEVMEGAVHQVQLASLPRNQRQDSLACCLDARVLITDDALNPFHATSEQAFQEGSLVDFRFAQ